MLAGAAAAVGVPSIWISNMKTYDGPVSDHFDGTRFFDRMGPDHIELETTRVIHSGAATHFTFKVVASR